MQRMIARQLALGTRIWYRGQWYQLARKTMHGEGAAGPFFDLAPLGPYPPKRQVSFRVCLLDKPPAKPIARVDEDAAFWDSLDFADDLAGWRCGLTKRIATPWRNTLRIRA